MNKNSVKTEQEQIVTLLKKYNIPEDEYEYLKNHLKLKK